MNLGFCSLASGSSGNCYLIKSDTTNLILDTGISCKAIKTGLESLGISLLDLDGILITHDHIDHVKGLKTLLKKSECPVYASYGTLEALTKKIDTLPWDRLIEVEAGDEFDLGDFHIKVFNLSHDAHGPVSYVFTRDGYKAAVVTDTGYVTQEIFENVRDADILALEANHERNILLYGSYPYPLKLRILSDLGHLSNEACAHALIAMLRTGSRKSGTLPKIFLAHLSQENNTPEQAMITVRNFLEEEGFLVGRDLELRVLERDKRSQFFTI